MASETPMPGGVTVGGFEPRVLIRHYFSTHVETVKAMSETWRGTGEGSKLNALEKWQLMLIFAARGPLHRGGAPYQDAQLVMQAS
jgi:hypothetical protein